MSVTMVRQETRVIVQFDGRGDGDLPMARARGEAVRVLLLGGWSPGPLDFIRHAFADRCIFVEPALHMPPSGVRWCCTWEALLIVVAAWSTLYSLAHVRRGGEIAVENLAVLLTSVVALPFLVVLLVRGSIRRSVTAANRAIHRKGIEVVVGFSWGGGVACWLLHEGGWSGPTLMLAPTLAAMASAARLPVARPFFRRSEDDTHIFHASHDGFCPRSQHETLQATGARMHLCEDGHTLDEPRSTESIGAAFQSLLESAEGRRDGVDGS